MNERPIPVSDLDLFCDSVLEHPYPAYASLRRLGPVVYLRQTGAYALTGHNVVREALKDHGSFTSGQGVTFNDGMNAFQAGTVLGSDPPHHTRLRAVVARLLAPKEMKALTDKINALADELVATLVRKGRFDAVNDLARTFPPSIVCDLIGLPRVGRRKLLHFADMHFNAFGPLGDKVLSPLNERARRGWEEMQPAMAYIGFMAQRLSPGSMGNRLYAAAERGEITRDEALRLLASFLVAGLDTTVRSIGTAVHCLATHPAQWQMLKDNPRMVPSAYNEVLRFDSPSQILSRFVPQERVIDGYRLPAKSRVALLFASANRDEARYERADVFDITREAQDQLSFGHGVHACLGQVLARIEAHAILQALLRHAQALQLAEPPERLLNCVLRGYARLPVSAEPAPRTPPARASLAADIGATRVSDTAPCTETSSFA